MAYNNEEQGIPEPLKLEEMNEEMANLFAGLPPIKHDDNTPVRKTYFLIPNQDITDLLDKHPLADRTTLMTPSTIKQINENT